MNDFDVLSMRARSAYLKGDMRGVLLDRINVLKGEASVITESGADRTKTVGHDGSIGQTNDSGHGPVDGRQPESS